MPNVLQFRPRKPSAPVATTAVLEGSALRAEIEEAAQAALDQADRLIALLDNLDGSTDAEPSLGAPKGHEGHEGQIVWLRGSASDGEITSPEQR